MRDRSQRLCWVLLLTEGMSIMFPAEVYGNEHIAEREGERWAWILSKGGRVPIGRPFPGRWEVGDVWIRLVQTFLHADPSEVWVGTHWTRHGYPEPEAELFMGRADGKEWVVAPLTEGVLSEVHETPWLVSATYSVRGMEEESVVQLAKVVS